MLKKLLNSYAPGFFIGAVIFAIGAAIIHAPLIGARIPITPEELWGAALLTLLSIMFATISAVSVALGLFFAFRVFTAQPDAATNI
tara:strand:+ start:296 stop:553 length:258 start_codon:yes stop_codon:yes gene_type:complete